MFSGVGKKKRIRLTVGGREWKKKTDSPRHAQGRKGGGIGPWTSRPKKGGGKGPHLHPLLRKQGEKERMPHLEEQKQYPPHRKKKKGSPVSRERKKKGIIGGLKSVFVNREKRRTPAGRRKKSE